MFAGPILRNKAERGWHEGSGRLLSARTHSLKSHTPKSSYFMYERTVLSLFY